MLRARRAACCQSGTHTHRFSKTCTNTQTRVGTGLWEAARWGKEAKLWWIFVRCSSAHNFLLNQKELGKHKHGWVMLSLMGLELEQTFFLSLSLSVSLPACELDPSFLLINNNRVKRLLVSWRKSLPWCTRSNLATVSSEEKYWRGLLCLNATLGWRRDKGEIYRGSGFGLIQLISVLIHYNHSGLFLKGKKKEWAEWSKGEPKAWTQGGRVGLMAQ